MKIEYKVVLYDGENEEHEYFTSKKEAIKYAKKSDYKNAVVYRYDWCEDYEEECLIYEKESEEK